MAASVSADEWTIERFSKNAAGAKDYEKVVMAEIDSDKANLYYATVFKEDDGKEYLRLKHELEKPIAAKKIVEFEMGFTSASDPYIDRKDLLNIDVVKCVMVQNSQNNVFWTQSSSDGKYVCSNYICDAPDTTFAADASPSDTDWKNPIIDNDVNNPFCTKSTDAAFACSKIQCI